jgi:hypothetical protein
MSLRLPVTHAWIALALMAAPALAEAKTKVSLTVVSQADAGTPSAFSWSARHAVKGGRVVVQRQVGTAHRAARSGCMAMCHWAA